MLVCAFSWEQRKLNEYLTVSTKKNTEDKYDKTDVLSVSGEVGVVNQIEFQGRSFAGASVSNYGVVETGDVVYTKSPLRANPYGIIKANKGKSGIVSTLYAVYKTIQGTANADFIECYFDLDDRLNMYLKPLVNIGAKHDMKVTDENALKGGVLFPSYEEQCQIADFFSRLDTLITLHQRECFSFDFGSRSAKVAQKTISWEQRKLSDMVERVTRKNENLESELPLTISAQYGLIDQNEFFDKRIASRDVSGYYLLKKGEFAYNKSTSSDAPWGAVKRLDRYEMGVLSTLYIVFALKEDGNIDSDFLVSYYDTDCWHKGVQAIAAEGARNHGLLNITPADYFETVLTVPSNVKEQHQIGTFFAKLDSLITLHQREPPKEDKILNDIKTDTLFHEYYCQWLVIYKEGSVRGVTMQKYHLTAEWVKKLIPDVKLCDFDRITYQQLINDYAETHERQTTMDFHHQLKGAILDAVDDGLIARDPTRKVIIKGKSPNDKKKKYLSRYELQKLLTSLDLNSGLNMDWLILLIAKTGMRFSEAIAVTPMDFDFTHQTLSVNKTWDYKGEGGFQPTKNKSSVRKIRLDWQTVGQFYAIVRELNDTAPIFVSKEKKIYNSTLNDVLERHCKAVGIPTISVHGLRHTHASLLLFDGVSIASVAQRLGHSSINTTQKTYLHIIRELENKDIDLIMKSISSLLD